MQLGDRTGEIGMAGTPHGHRLLAHAGALGDLGEPDQR
jgi:hypothetical protein